jgi:hypothetical protein
VLGTKCSGWLADVVEEAIETQRKDGFARLFREEARVLKVRTGSNKAGCFLEAAVFVEGDRKGVIRLPEGPPRAGAGNGSWKSYEVCLRNSLRRRCRRTLSLTPEWVVVRRPSRTFSLRLWVI